jgi:hypothetical protein
VNDDYHLSIFRDRTECEAGSYYALDTGWCVFCQVGFYSSVANSDACQPCGPAYYTLDSGATECAPCPAGKYSGGTEDGYLSCEDCPANTFSAIGASECTRCEYGFSSDADSSNCSLDLCPAGTQWQAGKCIECPVGYFSSLTEFGTYGCLPCDPGTESVSSGSTSCLECVDMTYSPDGSPCQKCPPNSFSSYGASACRSCPSGSIVDDSADSCRPCEPGTYALDGDCAPCAPGLYSQFSRDECVTCGVGFTASDDHMSCEECASGTYSTYDASSGAHVCTPCPLNKYSSSAGQLQCESCEDGTYANSTGSTFCISCYEHYSSEYCSFVPQRRQLTTCSAGYGYSGTCTICSAGTYSNTVSGSSSCVNCPSGYISGQGASVCSMCPVGTQPDTCNEYGCTFCAACPSGSYNSISGSYCDSCPPGQYAPSIGMASCIDCSPGTYTSSWGMTSCSLAPSGVSPPILCWLLLTY